MAWHIKELSAMNGTNIVNEAIEQKAIEIRRATTIKLPDSIIAATAIILDAVLLTDDDRLLSFSWPGLLTQSLF